MHLTKEKLVYVQIKLNVRCVPIVRGARIRTPTQAAAKVFPRIG